MQSIKLKVQCFKCRQIVDKSNTITLESVTKDPRYACSNCYKKSRSQPWGFGDEVPYKKDYFCERCKYKFSSKRNTCPYCSKSDRVEGGNVTVKELIKF